MIRKSGLRATDDFGGVITSLRPALLLDRDGVINVEKNYVHRIEDFDFVDGIFDLCRAASAAGMAIIVITNQAGIGRGLYTEDHFWVLTDWMIDRFAKQNAPVDRVYFCPCHPEHGVGKYHCESFDRKPNPGMILRAQADLDLDLGSSLLVGDKLSDILAGQKAGVGFNALLLGRPDIGDAVAEPDLRVASLHEVWPKYLELVIRP